MMFGVSSMVAPLRRVALRKPDSMTTADAGEWHYGDTFDGARVAAEHAGFVDLVAAADAEILWMDAPDNGNADAVFTFDASIMTPFGAVLLSPGKPLRRGEQALHRAFYDREGIPVIGEIDGDACCEGGDTLWIDDTTLAVGRGYRTDQAGIDRLAAILGPRGIDILPFDLPHHHGPAACLHLLSLISPVADRLALIHGPLLPVALVQLLGARGYHLLPAPESEFSASGGLNLNVLATAPGRCIMVDGFPLTQTLLESEGIRVSTFHGDALCIGGEGGPTCLTRPLLRA